MGNKFNVLISAAILVTTVYYLWIKIRKRNSKRNEKNIEIKNSEIELFKDDVVNNDAVHDESCMDDVILLSVDNTSITYENSFTTNLCNDFKGLQIASPIIDEKTFSKKETDSKLKLEQEFVSEIKVDKRNNAFKEFLDENKFTQETKNVFYDEIIEKNNITELNTLANDNELEEGEIADDSLLMTEEYVVSVSSELQDVPPSDIINFTEEIKIDNVINKEIAQIEESFLEDGEINDSDSTNLDITESILESIDDDDKVENEIKNDKRFSLTEMIEGEMANNYEVPLESDTQTCEFVITKLIEMIDGEEFKMNETIYQNEFVQEIDSVLVNDYEKIEHVENMFEHMHNIVEEKNNFVETEDEEIDNVENDVEHMNNAVENKFEANKIVAEHEVEKKESVAENEFEKKESVAEHEVEEKGSVAEHEVEEKESVAEHEVEEKESVAEHKAEEKESVVEHEVYEKENVVEREVYEKENVVEREVEEKENVVECEVEEKENIVEREVEEKENVVEHEVEEKENVVEREVEEKENVVEREVEEKENVVEHEIEEKENVVEHEVEEKENVVEHEVEEKESVVEHEVEEKKSFVEIEVEEKESVVEHKVEEKESVVEHEVEEKDSVVEHEVEEKESVVELEEEEKESVVELEEEEKESVVEHEVEEKESVVEHEVEEKDSVVEHEVEEKKSFVEIEVEEKEIVAEHEVVEAVEDKEYERNETDEVNGDNIAEVINTTNQSEDSSNGRMSSFTMSEPCDYVNDYEDSLDNLITDKSLMNYIDDCLHESSSDRTSMTLKNDLTDDCDGPVSIENWQNDEDSLNNIKRDFYELSDTVCSPHPSSESDHAHCVNNLTERVATHSAESIFINTIIQRDSDSTPTLSSPNYDSNCCPELYVEKIQFGDKELDVVYFDESVLEECGVISDARIIRTIPVGISGRIIGKKGKTKNELLKKYGAELLIYNHPSENCKQVLQITCSPSMQAELEKWADKTLEQILKNTIQTTVSNPEWLKPMIPIGKMVPVQVIDMPTIQHLKLRIHDPIMIRAYNKMQAEINADYANADSNALLPSPVATGCICIAMIRPDYFLRAEIINIYDQYAIVYLYDLGKTHQTCLYYLFKIREKYMRVPFQVLPARMPHAVIKNKKFTPAMLHRRFLCDQKTLKPLVVRAFFPRMNTCCEPCVHLYVSRSSIDGGSSDESECVDLLELLVSIDVCDMVTETIDCQLQVTMNEHHHRTSHHSKDRTLAGPVTPAYFEPCNGKFYEEYLQFQYSDSVSASSPAQ